jgi:hypothetical protein
MAVILDTPELKITTQPDSSIEPGHQWIIISDTPKGRGMASVLSGRLLTAPTVGTDLRLAHDFEVDEMLKLLFDLVAEIRVTAPSLIQLPLIKKGKS